MKLICEVSVFNRLAPQVKPRSQQSTLALGFASTTDKTLEKLFLIHFTNTNKTGTRYKVKQNIERVFMRFVNDGKVTISLKQPPHDLQIRCERIQLKAFLEALKAALEGKQDLKKYCLSTLAVVGVSKSAMPVIKMEITKPSDYPLKGLPKSLETLTVTNIRKQSLDSHILALLNLRVLIINNNCIQRIPERLGELPLVQLDLSSNELNKSNFIDDWRWLERPTIQKSLRNVNLSDNQLEYLPLNVTKLDELTDLNLKNNQIQYVPFSIRRLKKLRELNLSKNPFKSMPYVMENMNFQVLDLSDCEQYMQQPCPLGKTYDGIDLELESIHNSNFAATLFQIAATCVIKRRVHYNRCDLPTTVIDALKEYPFCGCGKLCPPSRPFTEMKLLKLRSSAVIRSYNAGEELYGHRVFCNPYCRINHKRKR